MYGRRLITSLLWAPDLVSAPSSVNVALCLAVPVANAGVDQILEPTATEYTQVTYGIGGSYWGDDGYGGLYNIGQIVFPQVLTLWGFILGYAIIDPVAGQVVDAGALLEPFVADVNVTPTIEPGTIALGLSD